MLSSDFTAGFAVTPDGSTLYVTQMKIDAVTVIDVDTHTVTATIPVSTGPYGIAVSPDGAAVYVSRQNGIDIISAATGTVTHSVAMPGVPMKIGFTPDGRKAYVTLLAADQVAVIDTATKSVLSVMPVGRYPNTLTVMPDGSAVYVSNYNDGTITVIDTSTDTVTATFPVVLNVYGVVFTPDGTTAYTISPNSKNAFVLDTATLAVTGTIPIGEYGRSLAMSPDGSRVLIAQYFNAPLIAIDVATNAVQPTTIVTTRPASDILFSPDGTRLFAHYTYDSVTIVGIDSAPQIPTLALPAGTAGAPYSARVRAVGFPDPTVALTSGTLPTGLTLSPTGEVTGTPTSSGGFTFELTATNSFGTATTRYSVVIGLPATGASDLAPTIILGSGMLLAGVVAVRIRMRRRFL